MRDYELVVLYHPDLEIDLDKALKKVEGLIGEAKGKVTFSESWGKRKLAYPINKQEHAVYVYYELSMPASALSKVEGTLNITNEVIRYLITAPVPVVEEEEKEETKEESSDDKPAEDDKE